MRLPTGITDNFGDALYPVIGGTNVPGMDILSNSISLSGTTLTVSTRIVDLSHPSTTAASIPGTAFLHYVTRCRWAYHLFRSHGKHCSK